MYIGPEIPEAYAIGIINADTIYFGVFTLNSRDAQALAAKTGTPRHHPPHGGSGYYQHYHKLMPDGKNTHHAHVWFFM